MLNIFLFIRRYFHFIFFLLLQVFSIYLIVHYSKYHEAVFGASANKITGKINKEYNSIEYYFQLKRTNDSLVKANEVLYNKLKADYNFPDTISKKIVDTLLVDSILQYRNYTYLSAKIVANSVVSQSNFIVLSGANVKKLKANMGIVDVNNNVVGIITEVDGDYAVVMSLLHKDSHISGKLMKGGETGTLSWDGKEPNMVNLTGISKSAKVAKGDSIITSGYSTTFPKGIMIGTVQEIYNETATNNYRIKFRTAADFYNIQYVYAIVNNQQGAIDSVLEKIKKQQ